MRSRGRIFILALGGLALNLLLLFWKLSGSEIAGCGGGGGCDEVLLSRWSQVFGVPIPVLGVLVYGVLFIALWRQAGVAAAFCYGAISGSAVWMIFVQVMLLDKFCPWCMAAHGVGLLLAGLAWSARPRAKNFYRGLLGGLGAAAVLALSQSFGWAPASHRIDENIPGSMTEAIHGIGSGRKIAFDDGRKIYDNSALPGLGSMDAKHVLVEYFDYRCAACRTMSDYLSAMILKHPDQVRVLFLPVPLDHGCNPHLVPADEGHPGSCDLARLALAVWRVKPDAFPLIHRAFLSDPPPDPVAALALARMQVPPAELEAALRDPWLDRLLQANMADWISFSTNTRQLPKLLISEKRILHGLPSGEADFIRVMEKELGL